MVYAGNCNIPQICNWQRGCSSQVAEVAVLDADIERRQAIVELLSIPDAPSLRRGHRLILPGKPDRHQLVPSLAAAFVQQKLLELHEREAAPAIAISY